MKTSTLNMFAAACVAAASAAQAVAGDEKLSVELFGGGNVSMPGSFRGQTVPFESNGPAGSVTYDDLKFNDAYAHRLGGGAELDYALGSHLSTFARASYNQFNGDSVNIGSFEPSGPEASHPVSAHFGDTSTREFDLGARYTFEPWAARISPFVGAALGATHLTAMRATVDNLDGIGTTGVELGKPKTVFSQRIETGLQFSPGPNFDVRLTAAANHVNRDQRSDDPNLALLGLDNVRGDVRGHWDYPAELGAVWHF